MTFTVSRTGNAVATQTIGFATSSGSATSGTDFTANSGTLSFASGETRKTFTVQTTLDSTYEGGETFNVTLANNSAGSTISGASATGTILDDGTGPGPFGPGPNADDDRPTFSVADVTVSEGGQATFTVTRTGASDVSQKVNVSTLALASPDTAEMGDFTARSTTTLTFAAGVNTQTFGVQTTPDTLYEGAETLRVQLANASNGALISGSNGTATGTIVDDGRDINGTPANDDRPTLTVVGKDDVSEGSPSVFGVNLSNAYETAQTITLTLANVTTQSADYSTAMVVSYTDPVSKLLVTVNVSSGGTFSLSALVTNFQVRVTTQVDTVYEGAEAFSLTVAVSGGPSSSDTSTILDDGLGKVYNPNGTENVSGTPDDDSPKPATLSSTPPAPPAPAALAIMLSPSPPAVVPPQSFASELTPLAHALVPADPPMSMVGAMTRESGYQIPVSDTAPVGLSLYRGVTDQFVQSTTTTTRISLPFDAFIHSSKDAVIRLQAKQADDSNLPNWVQFDPVTGVFTLTPPPDFKGKLDLKILARDDDGREAVALFQMFIGEQTAPQPQSRDSFSEKLKMAGKRPITLVRVGDGVNKAPVREVAPVREAAPVRVRAG